MEHLNLYSIFHTVAKTGNISKAAAQLFISQPAVSKAIRKLEEEMGTTLFDRSSRGVILTDEGRILFDYVERAFENLSKGEEHIRKYTALGLGHIRIGVSTSLCKHILLDYLKNFIKEYPHIKVSIDCHSTINTLKLLKNDEIDIGLICDTTLPKDTIYKPVMEIHDIFVASADYMDHFHMREKDSEELPEESLSSGILAGNFASLIRTFPKSSNLQELRNLQQSPVRNPDTGDTSRTKELLEKSTLMVLEESNVTRDHVDKYLADQNIHCEQILEVNNMDLLIDFASIGMGIASVVREFAQEQLESGQIIELPLSVPIEKRTVGFAYSQKSTKSTALQKFIDYCKI